VVVAIEAIKDAARQIKNQQMAEIVKTHVASLLTIQLYPNHESLAPKFKPRFKDRG
jgi:hypothetical protein